MDAKICDRCDAVIREPNLANVVKSWTHGGGPNAAYDVSRDLCDDCYRNFKDWIARAPAKVA